MTTEFDRCLAYTLNEEGGYAELADDEVTNHGVKKSTWEDWVKRPVTKAEMKALSQNDVKTLYFERYWREADCPKLWYPLSLCVFDFAVHSGPRTATSQLQFTVGVQVDGVIGEKTLKAVNERDPVTLIKDYIARRLEYVKRSRRWKLYSKGWKNRFSNLQKFCLSEIAKQSTRVGK